MAANKLKITDLDFDDIKANLRAFLSTQTEFSDYNFEGSAMSVLLDLLAYNTHYNAMYTNLALNEMFLDSASKRDSLVSLANNFGYMPTSARAAKAEVTVTIPVGTSTIESLTLPKFTPFSASPNIANKVFYTLETMIATRSPSSSEFVFTGVQLYEGQPVTERFVVFADTDRFVLANQNIDTSTIKVTVQPDPTSYTSTVYDYSGRVVGVTSTDTVYFLREVEDGKYEVYFGRNNIGVQPTVGSVITIDYLVTSGSEGNDYKLFGYNGQPTIGVPVVTTITNSYGGAETESVDAIRYNTPRVFAAQERAVTADDYAALVQTYFGNVQSISVWGGENMSPPVYGKIYISVKPTYADLLTDADRMMILDDIVKPRAVLGMYPELVDPDFVYIQVDMKIYWDPALTNRTSSEVLTLVRQAAMDFSDENLQRFNKAFRLSKFCQYVDACEKSIINSVSTIHLRKNMTPTLNSYANYTINFNNAIAISGMPEQYVVSNAFYIDSTGTKYYIEDDGVGNLRLFYYNLLDYTKVVTNSSIGTVDYDLGRLQINDLRVTGLTETYFQFKVNPRPENILSKYNQIVELSEQYLSVTMIQDKA